MGVVKHSAMQTKYRFLTGNGLKWIAVVSMTIDHLAAVVLKGYVNAWVNLFSEKQLADLDVLYGWMRNLGRMAFPLFAFLLTEGFFHTGDRRRYRLHCCRSFPMIWLYMGSSGIRGGRIRCLRYYWV